MRNQLFLLAGLILGGCASQQPAMPPVTMGPGNDRACAALVFDAPITLYSPSVEITRDDRGQAALLGYEEGSTSYYTVFNDNRQTNDSSDGFVRESVTVQSGVSHRQ